MTRILVIEDAMDLRHDVIEMLSLEGFEVLGAENGAEGLQLARETPPDLIVCDIMMPELDGYGVLAELRRDPKTANIPFVFLTAKTDRIDMRHGMVLGADDYLTKPFLVSELLESIRSQLRKRAELNNLAERRLEELRENIITALPHELRTPLNTVIGFSEMLMAECQRLKPDQIADWAQHIHTAALRLYRLVENYLFYVRIESAAGDEAQIEQLRHSVLDDPSTIIEFQSVHKAQNLGRESDLVLELTPSPIRMMDRDLNKIIEELVDNAFKFSVPGTPVRVTAGPEGPVYIIRVTDSGRGMTAEQIKIIGAYMQFDRWFYEQQGTGLGLTIARRLAEIYGGELVIDSVPDESTTITVRLQRVEQQNV